MKKTTVEGPSPLTACTLPGFRSKATPINPTARPIHVLREGRSPETNRKMAIHSGIAAIINATIPEGTCSSAMDTLPMPKPSSINPKRTEVRISTRGTTNSLAP